MGLRLTRVLNKEDIKRIQGELTLLDNSREKILKLSRSAVRFSSLAIIQAHRLELKKAEKTLSKAKRTLDKLKGFLDEGRTKTLMASSLTAFQEYAEAKLLLSFISSGRIASLKEVGVDSYSYVLGLLDFIGELRRTVLNALRLGDPSKAEAALTIMEGIYEELYSLNHASLIPNFRHKMDAARKILEATRGDLVAELRKASLEKAIKRLEDRISRVKK